jgi:hypothetical protein
LACNLYKCLMQNNCLIIWTFLIYAAIPNQKNPWNI